MNKALQDWPAALRSGKYAQGGTHLRTRTGKYSAVGVLVALSGWKWKGPGERAYYLDRPEDPLLSESASLIPAQLRDKLGLDAGVLGQVYRMQIAGKSFALIADYLEGVIKC